MAEFQGIIVIHKEKGFTSHDVVAKLRGILHMEEDRPYRHSGPGCNRSASGGSWKRNQAGGSSYRQGENL